MGFRVNSHALDRACLSLLLLGNLYVDDKGIPIVLARCNHLKPATNLLTPPVQIESIALGIEMRLCLTMVVSCEFLKQCAVGVKHCNACSFNFHFSRKNLENYDQGATHTTYSNPGWAIGLTRGLAGRELRQC